MTVSALGLKTGRDRVLETKMTLRLRSMQWLLLFAGGCGMGASLASPLSQDETAKAPDSSLTVPMIPDDAVAGQRLGAAFNLAEPADDGASAASGGAARSVRRAESGNLLLEPFDPSHAGGRSSPAGIRRSGAPLEENPRVELLDVFHSVALAAARSVTWVRVRTPRRHAAGEGGPGVSIPESAPETSEKVQYDPYGPGGTAQGSAESSWEAGSGDSRSAGGNSARGERVNLVREAVQMVREVVNHPLTWVLAILFAIASLTASVVRGKGDK